MSKKKGELKSKRQNTRPTEDSAWKNIVASAKGHAMRLGEYLLYCTEVAEYDREQTIHVSTELIPRWKLTIVPKSVGEPMHAVRIGELGEEAY